MSTVQFRDERALLMACVEKLRDDEQRFVEQFLTHCQDMQRIGKALDISTEAARMRWVRLRGKLREMVAVGRMAA